MTRHYKSYQEQITSRKLIKITCDRCGNEIPRSTGYDERDFELSFTTGRSYYNSGHKEGWQVEDLCDPCIEWLKAFLIENDVKLSKIEVDW